MTFADRSGLALACALLALLAVLPTRASAQQLLVMSASGVSGSSLLTGYSAYLDIESFAISANNETELVPPGAVVPAEFAELIVTKSSAIAGDAKFFEFVANFSSVADVCVLSLQPPTGPGGPKPASGVALRNARVTNVTPMYTTGSTLVPRTSIDFEYTKIALITYLYNPSTGAYLGHQEYCWDRTLSGPCTDPSPLLSCPAS